MDDDNRSAPGSGAAAHLMEIAARDVEAWRQEARTEADELLRNARTEAERTLSSAKTEAESILANAKAEVARLERLGSEHRERLRSHAQELLSHVDG